MLFVAWNDEEKNKKEETRTENCKKWAEKFKKWCKKRLQKLKKPTVAKREDV